MYRIRQLAPTISFIHIDHMEEKKKNLDQTCLDFHACKSSIVGMNKNIKSLMKLKSSAINYPAAIKSMYSINLKFRSQN
uniref:Uncharacterized protein n=1 Tax=Elaeophora elaphi TaxID=1147741 RepID=A0A0R3RKG8_9BILA